jgi:hypothetical protein
MIKFSNNQAGMASIPTVLVLMALIISVGVLISSISISDNASVSDTNNSGRALNYAQLGAKDALERVVRNKDYVGSYTLDIVSGGCVDPYNACANVVVATGSDPKIINVEGRSRDLKRKIQVDVTLDSNGLITSYKWQEN